MRIGAFFEKVLGAKLNNVRQSWGAHDELLDRIYLRVWHDQIEKKDERERVRVDSKTAKLGIGRNERRRHIEQIKQGAESYGVVCQAKYPNDRSGREIRDFDDSYLLKFGRIVEDGDSTFAEITGRVPVASLLSTPANNFRIEPGDVIRRKDLHKKYGGRTQGGIGSSAKSANVFLFSDPDSGEQHGYFDGWQADGCFHYTGEGQLGDQRLIQGNLAILNAAKDGREIHLFSGTGGDVEYVDQFKLDEKETYYLTDAPETGGGPLRSVIVFRLRPLRITPKRIRTKPHRSIAPEVESVPVEAQHTERAFVEPAREEYEAERRESSMVQKYKEFMEEKGHDVCRLKIKPANEVMPMFCDIYVKDLSLLVEAKGSTDRQSIRMAIGQLIDYRRFVDGKVHCAILVPSRPREHLVKLIESAGMRLTYEDKNSFKD